MQQFKKMQEIIYPNAILRNNEFSYSKSARNNALSVYWSMSNTCNVICAYIS